MTASRRLAAILAADVGGILAPDGRGRGGDGAAYAHAGKMDEAKAELAEARRLNPAITVKWMMENTPNLPVVFDGVRKAGPPEE